jgi:hypothetical protein
MKNYLLTSVICYFYAQFFSIQLMAQTDPLRQKLDLVFANINKNQVPTGFLEEYGSPLLPLDVFSGMLSDSNKVNMNVWRQAYATLYTSRIYGTNPLPSITTVNTTINNIEADYNTRAYVSNAGSVSGSIPVIMFYSPYNYLRPDALSSNLLSVSNNQLYDVPGRTQSPYGSRIGFAATPTAGYAPRGMVSLIFKPELFYNTSGKSVSTLSIDFADGRGYLTAGWNSSIISNYTTAGTKNIKIKVMFTDGSVVQCYSILEITDVSINIPQARFNGDTVETELFVANAKHSGGMLYIEYDENDSERGLNKPLIVIEGFDAHKVAPELQEDNYSFNKFVDAMDRIALSYDLNHQLDKIAGYDLVFLDYDEGTDDIRRNAALVEEVITWVNAEKAKTGSIEQNVVLGISMGGLVGRYALADMTKQGIDTQTKLLITHDSPHRGANTPLGFQFLTRQLNDVFVVQMLNLLEVFPQITQANRLLDEPASQQMSIVRAVNESGGISYNSFLDGEYRNMITFPGTGPQPSYRVIATSLGSQCGQQNLSPHTELLRTTGKFFISPVPWIIRRSYNAEIVVNALPDYGQSKRLSKVRIWVNYRILSFVSISIDYTNKEAYSPNNLLPWDGAPGGSESVASQTGSLPSANYKWLAFFELSLNTTAYPGTFCFVPTVSALDIATIDATALTKSYVDGISPTHPSRVSTFIAHDGISSNIFNETHPRFTARNAEWMFNEMQDIKDKADALTCSEDCQTVYAIPSGPSTLCTSNSPFSLQMTPPGSEVSWSVAPSNYFVVSAGMGSTTTLQATPNARINGTITFNVRTGCRATPAQVSKTFWVGKPLLAGSYNDGGFVRYTNPGESPYYNQVPNLIEKKVDMVCSGAKGSWQRTAANPTNTDWNVLSNQLRFYFFQAGQTATFRYSASNACGTTAQDYSFKSVSSSGGGGGGDCTQYTVSPNPSKNNILNIASPGPSIPSPCGSTNISTAETSGQTESNLFIQSVGLYDSNGQFKRAEEFAQGTTSASLDISDLQKGVYIVKISNGDYIETHRIIKE